MQTGFIIEFESENGYFFCWYNGTSYFPGNILYILYKGYIYAYVYGVFLGVSNFLMIILRTVVPDDVL